MSSSNIADLSGTGNLRGINLSGADLTYIDLYGADLSGANLSDADLSGANLSDADLSGAYLSDANLSGADLTHADLIDADLDGADLSGAYLNNANLSGADLTHADLIDADLNDADLSGANLSGADLSYAILANANLHNVNLDGAHLYRADLYGAYLDGADLEFADLRDADLSGADLEDADLESADLSGANLNGAYLNGAHLYRADLSGADLSYAVLYGADLYDAYLEGADLYGAYLDGADLEFADLTGAKLNNADLSYADLKNADLSYADLTGAELDGADLSEADLDGANLSYADLTGADLSGADLTGAKLINSVGVPSGIDLSSAILTPPEPEPTPEPQPEDTANQDSADPTNTATTSELDGGTTDQSNATRTARNTDINLEQRHTDIAGGDLLQLGYALKGDDDTGNPGGNASNLGVDSAGLTNVAVLGPNTSDDRTYTLEISAESLDNDWDLDSADIVLKYDTQLFEKIDASHITLGDHLTLEKGIVVDDDNGLIRIAAASLSSDIFDEGDSIGSEAIFASIKVDFDESYFEASERIPDANGKFTFEGNPLGFELSANSDETVFSRTFTSDADGFEVTGGAFNNRDIKSLGDLKGNTTVDEGKVNLYQAEIKFQEQDGGLILGTKRVIGSGSGFTNLLRKGDLITARTSVENIGNSLAKDVYIEDAGNVAGANFKESRFISKTSNGIVTVLDSNSNVDLMGGEFKSTLATTDPNAFDVNFLADIRAQYGIVDVVNVGDFSRDIYSGDLVSTYEMPSSSGVGFDLGAVGNNTNILLLGDHMADNNALQVQTRTWLANSVITAEDGFLVAYSDGANSHLVQVQSHAVEADGDSLSASRVTTIDTFDGIGDVTELSTPGAFAGIINDAIDYPYDPSTQESTEIEIDVSITGEAGDVIDLTKGIFKVSAEDTEQNPDPNDQYYTSNKGSKNLITFQGDLNYDGRVSMKDLAYLNAGAARQQTTTENPTGEDLDGNGVVDASVATDVDANFDKEISLADLAVLDADWGKTLHTGDEQFQGSAPVQDSAAVSWMELDSQGDNATWDNSSFKDQNAIEAEDSYVGSLESPTSTGVIGADGNTTANDNDITGTEFQDSIPV